MSNYDRELRETDAMQRDMRLGIGLQVMGWTLLAFNGIILTFVWSGVRIGSNFWLYWLIIEGVLGMALAKAGGHYKSKAGTEISRLGSGTKAA